MQPHLHARAFIPNRPTGLVHYPWKYGNRSNTCENGVRESCRAANQERARDKTINPLMDFVAAGTKSYAKFKLGLERTLGPNDKTSLNRVRPPAETALPTFGRITITPI